MSQVPSWMALRQQRRAEGRCVQCGVLVGKNDDGEPLARCPRHLKEAAKRSAKSYEKHGHTPSPQRRMRDLGKCPQCGGDYTGPFWKCEPCRTKQRAYQNAAYRRKHGVYDAKMEDSLPVQKWTRRWAGKRVAVADIRYIAHVRPAGSYVEELLGARVIR